MFSIFLSNGLVFSHGLSHGALNFQAVQVELQEVRADPELETGPLKFKPTGLFANGVFPKNVLYQQNKVVGQHTGGLDWQRFFQWQKTGNEQQWQKISKNEKKWKHMKEMKHMKKNDTWL